MKMLKKLVVGMAFGATFALQAVAANVSLGTSWLSYDETIGVGNFFSETWEASISGVLNVTDLNIYGDAFDVYVNGVLVGSTAPSTFPTPDPASPPGVADPDLAWADPNFSKGSFGGITAGDLITIKATALPAGYSDSTVAVRMAVPEPTSLALIGLALAGAGMARRRQKA